MRHLADLGDGRQLALLDLGRPRQQIVHGGDLADDVGPGQVGVLLAQRLADRLDLVDPVRQHDRGGWPAPEQAIDARVEVARLLGGVELGVQLAEVVLERILQEVPQPEGRDDRHRREAEDQRRAAPLDEPCQRPQVQGRAPAGSALVLALVDEDQDRRQHRERRGPARQRADGAHDAELIEAAEAGHHERRVRRRGRDRRHQRGAPRTGQRLAQRARGGIAVRSLLLVARHQHDGVVDAVAQDDRAQERRR